jgi:3-isopropylmalate/(R)-2-methylmalate dehydratase small subunit
MSSKGRVWRFGDDIDTDQIYPGKYLPITDKKEMARHAMEGTEIGERFIHNVKHGDIVVAGTNFGCGSSREHATVAIKGCGISVIIAQSFASIFRRNCVNIGLPILLLDDVGQICEGDIVEANPESGEVKNITQNKCYMAIPVSPLEREIMAAGGLLAYLKQMS